MANPQRPGQSRIIQTLMQLNAAQVSAQTPEDIEAADHELALFLRLNGEGRIDEYYASRKGGD